MFCLVALFIVHRVMHSFYGNAVRAVREDEECALSLGLSTRWLRVQIYVLHAVIMGAAGALYAHSNQFIGPDNFVLLESALVLTGVIVGGIGSLPGAVIGGIVMVLLPEALREVGNLRAFAFGLSCSAPSCSCRAACSARCARSPVSPRHAEAARGRGATVAMSGPVLRVDGAGQALPGPARGRRRELRRRTAANWSA